MVVEDKMQSLISGLGGEEWLEGKISWRWNYREIGVPADRVCEGTIEKISFGLVRVEGYGRKLVGKGCHGAFWTDIWCRSCALCCRGSSKMGDLVFFQIN